MTDTPTEYDRLLELYRSMTTTQLELLRKAFLHDAAQPAISVDTAVFCAKRLALLDQAIEERLQPTSKAREIVILTDRAPVSIEGDEWPIIARAERLGPSVNGTPAAEDHLLVVRQHQDRRAIVYGVRAAADVDEDCWRGGELLQPGADLAGAILRVGESLTILPSVIRACIASLPAEELS